MAELEQRRREDPVYRAKLEQEEADLQARVAEREAACRPVVEELRSHGVQVDSVWDLWEQPGSYPIAMPILLKHLRRDYAERALFDIGMALPNKPDATWWDELKDLYLTTTSCAVRDRVAAAMSGCAVRRHYDDLLAFIADPRLGESRIYFLRDVHRIGNRMRPGAGRAVIESLADDQTLGKEATAILRNRSPKR